MEPYLITFAFKADNVSLIDNYLNKNEIIESIKKNFNVHIFTDDLRDEFRKMGKFLTEINMEKQENPFFQEFDIDSFGVIVEWDIPNRKNVELIEPLMFALAQQISKDTETDCLVMFDDMKIPIGLFERGNLKEVYANYSSDFFRHKAWKPNIS